MIWIICLTALWLGCGVFGYAISFAYWQREFSETANDPDLGPDKYVEDLYFSIFIGVCGVMGLIIFFVLTDYAKYGLKFR